MQSFNERQLKKLVEKQKVHHPRVESEDDGYQLRFNVGAPLFDAARLGESNATLSTFRGQPKRFKSHRTLIRNMKKLGIDRWRFRLDNEENAAEDRHP